MRGKAVTAFGDWAMCRLESAEVGGGIGHEPTRRFLEEVGVPLRAPFFQFDVEFLDRPVVLGEYASEAAGEWGRLLRIGHSADSESLWLDPESGVVRCFPLGWEKVPSVVNGGVAELVTFLAEIERQRFHKGVPLDELEDDELAYELLEEMTEQLMDLDPAAFEGESPWGGWLDDPLAWGGLEWEWDSEAEEFLKERGIALPAQD
ncbi:SUKH-4 family immunity protein [Kitasatospora sp. NPDC101183]|uniref:SUKH-4 family immunity protein n=1 Tax=Kitasatospora sp. NPDC101183 TaxID=3364100 RepID=UPI00381CB6E8